MKNIIKNLKEGDLLIGSRIYSPKRNNDIDIYTPNEENEKYYRDLGYDVILQHPKHSLFIVQCVGIDNKGVLHYFNERAWITFERKSYWDKWKCYKFQ